MVRSQDCLVKDMGNRGSKSISLLVLNTVVSIVKEQRVDGKGHELIAVFKVYSRKFQKKIYHSES